MSLKSHIKSQIVFFQPNLNEKATQLQLSEIA